MRRRIAYVLPHHPVMFNRVQLEALAKKYVFVICVGENKPGSVTIPDEIVFSIPPEQQSSARKFLKSHGVNICKARVVGTDENRRLTFDPATDFLFSLLPADLLRYAGDLAKLVS